MPLLILVYGFRPKYAIPLSNFTILGSSITNMAMNLYKRHPGIINNYYNDELFVSYWLCLLLFT